MFSFSQEAPIELDLHAFSNVSEKEFRARLAAGERFVVFLFAVSVVVYSFRHPTKVVVLRNRSQAIRRGLPWTLLTLVLGWWSIPSGPIYTIQALAANIGGGVDVSAEILDHIRKNDVRYQYGFR